MTDRELLSMLHRLLSYYRGVGIEKIPAGEGTDRLMAVLSNLHGREGTGNQGTVSSSSPVSPHLSQSCSRAGSLPSAGSRKGAAQRRIRPEECNSLVELRQAMEACTRCRLHETRNHIVFGEGDEEARLMLIGEAPGRNEDLQGRPFVGKSGELLTKMLRAINIRRDQVFITSVVKCRPPRNRTPSKDEIEACLPWLQAQIKMISPEIILCLGSTAINAILGREIPIARLRGSFHHTDWLPDVRIAVTYHPAYLLRFGGERQKALKLQAWHDLQMVEKEYKKVTGDTHNESDK